MSGMSSQLFIAAGAILAAFVTGSIAVVGMLISKDQKTSEFRHAWIQEFRNELARYISLSKGKQSTKALVEFAQSEFGYEKALQLKEASLQKDYRELQESRYRIHLLANIKEHKDILEAVDNIFALSAGTKKIDSKATYYDDLISISQRHLKKEWIRVKTGEPLFRVVKAVAIAVFTFSILVLFFILLKVF